VSGTHLEDFTVGEVIDSAESYEMTAERIEMYATEFDPQPIHLDAIAAAQSRFGGIIASGWHTLSVTMRLMVRSNVFAGAPVIGVGVDRLRYLAPVRPGDVLRASAEVLEIRPSRSHADRGYLVLRVNTTGADGTTVISQEWTVLVPKRGAPAGEPIGA
jgi:acyl dehydratase